MDPLLVLKIYNSCFKTAQIFLKGIIFFLFIKDKRCISLLLDTTEARNDKSYQVLTTRGRKIDRVYYMSGFVEFVDWVQAAVQC